MEFTHESTGTKFSIPDRLTVAQLLENRSIMGDTSRGELFVRAWDAAVPLIVKWESKLLPDYTAVDFTLDTPGDAVAISDLIVWVGNTVAGHINDLRAVPKNS